MKRVFVTFLVAIFATALFAQNRTELKQADLPKKVTDYLTANFKDFSIEKAFKVEKEGVLHYGVIINKGEEKRKLTFDKDGNFIKAPVHTGKPLEKKPDGPPVKKDEGKPNTGAVSTPASTPAPAEKKGAPKK